MAGCCSDDHCRETSPHDSPAWRRALWIALAVNAAMFLAEIAAGVAAGSASLQADALDFLGDSTNYAISLWVAGMALAWRARAALLKGASLGLLGVWVIGTAGWHAWAGTLPEAEVMGVVGLLALLANAGVALMLYRYRGGDANMRSVWICSRNDAIGNLAVLLAAAGVFGTGTGWPDVIVAAIMARLGISGGWQIVGPCPRGAAAGAPSRGGGLVPMAHDHAHGHDHHAPGQLRSGVRARDRAQPRLRRGRGGVRPAGGLAGAAGRRGAQSVRRAWAWRWPGVPPGWRGGSPRRGAPTACGAARSWRHSPTPCCCSWPSAPSPGRPSSACRRPSRWRPGSCSGWRAWACWSMAAPH